MRIRYESYLWLLGLCLFCLSCGGEKYVGSLAEYPGEKEGTVKTYYESGKLYEEGQFKNGQYEGYRKIYFPEGGVETMESYHNNIFHGPFVKYYASGVKKVEGDYENGVMKGRWKTYYEDGSLKDEVTMSDNMENGPFVEYHPNGKQKAIGQYVNGEFEHGLLQLFDESGTLIKKMECDTGICRTIWTIETDE